MLFLYSNNGKLKYYGFNDSYFILFVNEWDKLY